MFNFFVTYLFYIYLGILNVLDCKKHCKDSNLACWNDNEKRIYIINTSIIKLVEALWPID